MPRKLPADPLPQPARRRDAAAPRARSGAAESTQENEARTPPARTTINDVARLAAVSKATVSRYLNGHTELLAPGIATRVGEAIRALGYRPSPAAQSLKHGRSRLVGLVVADITNPYSVAVLHGAEAALRAAGYMLLLFNAGNDGRREREALAALADHRVEGFLVNAPGDDAEAFSTLLCSGRPVVLIDRRVAASPLDLVSLDHAAAVRTGVGHLVDAGYRELLFVGEPARGVSSRRERLAAFSLETRRHPGVHGAPFESTAGAAPALDEALRSLQARSAGRPAAVLAGNAVVSLRVAAAAARLDLALGRQLGLLGFDETDWAPLVGPGLSTLSQPTGEIGRQAAQCLLDRMQGSVAPPRELLLPAQLIARGSTQRG